MSENWQLFLLGWAGWITGCYWGLLITETPRGENIGGWIGWAISFAIVVVLFWPK